MKDTSTPTANRLANESSPYLRQHQFNPVDWYPWGEEALEKARKEYKLIFLSVGYSACHWCHVMEKESFQNEEIAALLNKHFVCIKVDREERPDIDALYMEAVQQLTGHGGWPLSVFLLPDLRPIYGGTYFPPTDRYGRPGFKRLLETLVKLWQEEPHKLVEQAAAIHQALQVDLMSHTTPELLSSDLLEQATSYLKQAFDPQFGGFGKSPKFPQPAILSFLLREYHRTGDASLLKMVTHTLDNIASGGIYDQLAGGFHRYATDTRWLIPHFEKMLYDQALLTWTYLEAYQLTHNPRYQEVVSQTLAFVKHSMTSPEGGFYTALDADSAGEEGLTYRWTYEELRQILPDQLWEIARRAWGITPEGNWEGYVLLHQATPIQALAQELGISEQQVKDALNEARSLLLAVREQRPQPMLDDKIITAWNAMMMRAFTEAYNVFQEAEYLEQALQNAQFIQKHLYAPDGSLLHSYCKGEAHLPAYLDDYAYLAQAYLSLYESTGEWKWLHEAERLTHRMMERFWDASSGGFFFTQTDEQLIARRKQIMDGAIPAGHSIAIEVLQRLAIHRDHPEWRQQARHTLMHLSPLMSRYPDAFGYVLQRVYFELDAPLEIALVGPTPEIYLPALFTRFLPNKIIAQGKQPEVLPEHPLLQDKPFDPQHTVAYVCHQYTCEAPFTHPEALSEFLDSYNSRSFSG